MELHIIVSGKAHSAILGALEHPSFVGQFLQEVVADKLGVNEPHLRPAEYPVLQPRLSVSVTEDIGVQMRLTGISRTGRTPADFHSALKRLEFLAWRAIQNALKAGQSNQAVQVFCALELDGEIETTPRSGAYSSIIESAPVLWITATSKFTMRPSLEGAQPLPEPEEVAAA